MGKIVIFSGTTEGREISSFLCEKRIHHVVCVATAYGRDVMCESAYACVHTGRMDREEIRSFLSKSFSLVVDATHPYATQVSENIKAVTEELHVEYLRVVRESRQVLSEVNMETLSAILSDVMATTKGNILLTTGSKELDKLQLKVDEWERIYARVIPSVESIKACEDVGIPKKNIIAMQGPFSTDMNVALIREKNIACLVTKESGAAGGFDEKLEACERCGIEVIVIGRPAVEIGLTLTEVKEVLLERFADRSESESPKSTVEIALIGSGMGDFTSLTVETTMLIDEANLVFGPERLIKNIKDKKCFSYYRASDIIPKIVETSCKRAVVLFSGDCSFYSGASSFLKQMEQYATKYNVRIDARCYPGISSVSYLAARLGVSYSDAYVTSIHGLKRDDRVMAELKENLYTRASAFVLLSGDEDIRAIARLLESDSGRFDIYVGGELSYPQERIFHLSVDEAKDYCIPGLYVAYIINNNPERELLVKSIRDDQFIRNKAPMTKEVVRSEVVRLLQVKKGDIVYDLGSGTGSVSVQVAKLSPSVMVYAVEKKDEACECMKSNLEKFDCRNVKLIQGDALEELRKLELPDSVFIGGSSGEIQDILDELSDKINQKNKSEETTKSVRIVITAVSIETISQMEKVSNRMDVSDLEIKQIAVTNTNKVGNYHLLQAENPVFICSFNLGSVIS